jgi:hypothetical protein
MSHRPQHELASAHEKEFGLLSSFLDHLSEQGVNLVRAKDNRLISTDREKSWLIASFFDIDYEAFIKEKDDMIRQLQAQER